MAKLQEVCREDLPNLKQTEEVVYKFSKAVLWPLQSACIHDSRNLEKVMGEQFWYDIWVNSTTRQGIRELRVRITDAPQAQIDVLLDELGKLLDLCLPEGCWYRYSYGTFNTGLFMEHKSIKRNCIKVYYNVPQKLVDAAAKGQQTCFRDLVASCGKDHWQVKSMMEMPKYDLQATIKGLQEQFGAMRVNPETGKVDENIYYH